MYRLQFQFDVAKGHAREAIEGRARLNELARERGWRESTLWTFAFGQVNRFIAETEYESLAEYEGEALAQGDDAAYMAAFRSATESVVQGTGSTQMLETL